MSEEKLQQEFKAAFLKRYQFGEMAAHSNDDAAKIFYAAQWGWYASRDAVVIELPCKRYDMDICGDELIEDAEGSYVYFYQVEEAIKNAGVKMN